MKPLAKETMLTLMQYADGELAGEEREKAEKILREDPEAAKFVAELEALSKTVDHLVMSRVSADFDVSDAVMDKLEEAEPPKKVAPVRSIESARWKRIGVVAAATLALAAGVAFFMKQSQPEKTAAKPVPTLPPGPVTNDVAIEGPKQDEPKPEEEKTAGVNVNLVDSPQHAVSVIMLPEGESANASASSVVVWIDESAGGQ
jgi:anti-sigma factor RsiW